jgi:hypothetical protein
MTLAEQLKALKGKLNAENDLGGQRDMTKIAELEQQIADLNIQILAENQAQEAEVRVQEQAERLGSIKLPYDFSEVFGDPRANEIVIELIKEFQVEANEEYNEKLKGINADHLEELRAATDRELQLKRQNDDLQVKWEETFAKLGSTSRLFTELETAHNNMVGELQQSNLERDDALAKRDAAVAKADGIELLLSEKDEHINKLREEIAIGAKAAINVTHIPGTDRLAALVEQSKSAKINNIVSSDHPEVTFYLPSAEVPTLPVAMVEGQSVVEVAGKTLEERVIDLERAVFGKGKEEAA